MTVLTNSVEGITPATTTPTVGNSGGASGNAFDAVSIGAGSAMVSSSDVSLKGAMVLAYSAATSEAAYVQWDASMGTKTHIWGRAYFWLPALPAAALRIFSAFNGAGRAAGVQLGTAGKLALIDSANVNQKTGTVVAAIGQPIRIEWEIITSATVGFIEAKLFNSADSTSPDEIASTLATINTNTQATAYRFGRSESATGAPGLMYMDALELNDTGYPGPLGAAPGVTRPRRVGNRMVTVREAIR